MKTLKEVTLDALDLHASYELPALELAPAKKRLVVASGNAFPTAKILFADEPAIFRGEGDYQDVLAGDPDLDSGVVISASGKKHAPILVGDMQKRGLDTYLVTCDGESPAAKLLPANRVLVTKSNPEPITYNTSTYVGMMLLKTREDARAIRNHIETRVAPRIPDFTRYEAFYIVVDPRFDLVKEMFVTKFDELFGGRVNGRCYTSEQTLHAKTVVPWDKELFISVGYDNQLFGSERLAIPLPQDAGFAAMVATTYYVIGCIQEQFPPYFFENAESFKAIQEKWFQDLMH